MNYLVAEDEIMLMSDTLARGDGRAPLMWTTKVFPLLHLDAVWPGTGDDGFIATAYTRILEQARFRESIRAIHESALAPKLWADQMRHRNPLKAKRLTVRNGIPNGRRSWDS